MKAPRAASLLLVLTTTSASVLVDACVSDANTPPAPTCEANLGSVSFACRDASGGAVDGAPTPEDAALAPDATLDATTEPDAATAADTSVPPDAAKTADGAVYGAAPPPPACKGTMTVDPTFGAQGLVIDPSVQDSYDTVALQTDGKYLVTAPPVVARYNANGSIDTTFGTGGYADLSTELSVSTFRPQPNGDAIVGGFGLGGPGCALARLASNGALDPTFGSDGGYASCASFSPMYAEGFSILAQRPNGYVLAAGPSYTVSNEYSDMGVMQFDPNGILDTTFGSAGKALAGFTVETEPAVMLHSSLTGKLLPGGRDAGELGSRTRSRRPSSCAPERRWLARYELW